MKRHRLSWRIRDERGAIAVIVAILACVLFGIGAMAVDLGAAFSRKRATQADADLAALAGGGMLPDKAAAIDAAARYLLLNLPQSDDGSTAPTLSDLPAFTMQLRNPSVTDGAICFPADSTSDKDASSCVDGAGTATRIKVIAPDRLVRFGLANALPKADGRPAQSVPNVKVTAMATVELRTLGGKMLPFGVPLPCGTGSRIIKENTGNGGNGGGNDNDNGQTTMPTQGSAATRPGVSSASVSPSPLTEGQSGTISVTGTRFDTTAGQTRVAYSLGTTTVDAPAVSVASQTNLSAGIPGELSAGTWYVSVGVLVNGSWSWSVDNPNQAQSFAVTPACDSNRGDFGTLYSPRQDPNTPGGTLPGQSVLVYNIALGIDHGLQPYPGSLPQPPTLVACDPVTLPQSINDDNPYRDTNNCADVRPGFSSQDVTDGLITGGNGMNTPRLAKPVTCRTSGVPDTVNLLNRQVNNDVLSCFLMAGHKLGDLATATSPMLSADVFQSPRFMIVPLINVPTLPPNAVQGVPFYPIKKFAYAFITDETGTASKDNSNATSANGLTIQTQNVRAVRVFFFPIEAVQAGAPNVGPTTKYTGIGPKVPVLVN
jgi:hypothetical protein